MENTELKPNKCKECGKVCGPCGFIRRFGVCVTCYKAKHFPKLSKQFEKMQKEVK